MASSPLPSEGVTQDVGASALATEPGTPVTASTTEPGTPVTASAPESGAPEAEVPLPPLSASEFRTYNKLADQMDLFHNHFRQTWNMLHNSATTGRRPANMTIKQFLDSGLGFVRQLTMHHNIEETYMYPVLAAKMPEFRHDHGGGGVNSKKKLSAEASELIRQHREIHEGMDRFEEYLRKCRDREVDFEMSVLKEKMDSWGGVLWTHMDQEVETLGAENMRNYWSLDEMRKLSNRF